MGNSVMDKKQMARISFYRNYIQIKRQPKNNFDKVSFDREIFLIGDYGIKNKKEIYRYCSLISKIRNAARILIKSDLCEINNNRKAHEFKRKLVKVGILDSDYCCFQKLFSININFFLSRRLQTIVRNNGISISIHNSRVIIRQKHILVEKVLVHFPSFQVKNDNSSRVQIRTGSFLTLI